ncbi:glycyl tRNA synthetase [Perkinsela sp. CCAP 1560/4]|nr:glycyl tRNA synthetase [Perkinsela sp. CCAP 1560/4]|eukprot:KNH03922.1 glycyl tRNA synthetase [Perkinsela sp. CCAP 1560/4]
MSSAKITSVLPNFIREEFESVCKRRFFFGPSFEAYAGTSGLFDMGPSGVSIKNNILSIWRQHFVSEENMLEVESCCVTPEDVFKTSGHVERFTDVMSKDLQTGECVRLDKHIEDWCNRQLLEMSGDKQGEKAELMKILGSLNGMSNADLDMVVQKHGIASPSGNPLSSAFDFNLMFASKIGSESGRRVFMRPELAQGICLNFKRLLESCSTGFPFAACCVGQAFRNEIAPRASLLRVREFTLAEIEHFLNPDHKDHPKFSSVADESISIWSSTLQREFAEPAQMCIGEAVRAGIIDNETLGYFIGRVSSFMRSIGVKYIRFRQHLPNEMAHYAQDCWDCELLTSYGWMECVGIADRSAYDLKAHAEVTKKEFTAWETFETPVTETVVDRKIKSGLIGKVYGKHTASIIEFLKNVPDMQALEIEETLASESAKKIHIDNLNEAIEITRPMVSFSKTTRVIYGRSFVPAVVESSFGIGRILYALLEQSHHIRCEGSDKSETRGLFSISPYLAPWKASLFPLMSKPELLPALHDLSKSLHKAQISSRMDCSGAAIGKKYARVDEIGIPYAITVDYDTISDSTVTLRDRDSMEQIRVPLHEIVGLLNGLCAFDGIGWDAAKRKYPSA